MQTKLNGLNKSEMKTVLACIRDNAVAFKHTLRRRELCPIKRKIDVKATVKAATRTGGEPFVVKYKKPIKSHAKVVCMVDMSGSCRSTSTLALYFMGLMDDAFPGGCKKFVFVNSLVPVDGYFRDHSAEEGVVAVMSNVPTRGIYSNYGAPIQTLYEDYSALFGRETTFIIIGDARNNKYYSGAKEFKEMCDRCKNVFWLNPEHPSEWDYQDSIISTYRDAGAKVSHVSNVGELLGFLQSVND